MREVNGLRKLITVQFIWLAPMFCKTVILPMMPSPFVALMVALNITINPCMVAHLHSLLMCWQLRVPFAFFIFPVLRLTFIQKRCPLEKV